MKRGKDYHGWALKRIQTGELYTFLFLSKKGAMRFRGLKFGDQGKGGWQVVPVKFVEVKP